MTDILDAEAIAEGVLPSLRPQLRRVTVLDETDSTNAELARLAPAEQHAHAVLAEKQKQGRGRRARRWHSPAGGNIYFSLGWRFSSNDHAFSTLPLVVAIATANALKRAGLEGHGIKWPNDILVNGKKLAGILVELKSGADQALATMGIGINVRMPSTAEDNPEELIDRPWTDLASNVDTGMGPVNRNSLASALLDQLLASLGRFESTGFESFRRAWTEYDLLRDTETTLQIDDRSVDGIARGVSDTGELLLDTAEGDRQAFHAGEVRVFGGTRAF